MGISDSSTLILTVNTRLARWLQLHHHNKMASSGKTVWESPNIYFVDTWLRDIWLQSWPEQFVLSDLQSLHLWEQIVKRDSETAGLDLLHLRGAAQKAQEAHKLIQQYGAEESPNVFNVWSRETSGFYRWSRVYRQQLDRWSALDPADVLAAVHEGMRSKTIALPKQIIFAGFEEIYPRLNLWIEFLKAQGTQIGYYPAEPAKEVNLEHTIQSLKPNTRRYQNREEEAEQCARWVRSVYSPKKTIGIVVTQMEEYRDLLYRELSAELCPENVFPWKRQETPFNFSLGTPLIREPMVHRALQVLSINEDWIPLPLFSSLLTSPFFKTSERENFPRLQYDWNLRRKKRTHVSISREAVTVRQKGLESFAQILDCLKLRVNDRSKILPSEWAQTAASHLHQMDWPGGNRTLSSGEYQIGDAFNECLDELATLDSVLGTIEPRTALLQFTRIVEEKSFQPKTLESPVQVVGLLESTGMQFDHLWIMGCHADVLPNLHAPNPYIPYPLQREHQLPYCTPKRTLLFYERILQRLLEASPACEISYPAFDNQNELMISALLRQTDTPSPAPIREESSKLIHRFPATTVPETFTDKEVLPFLKDESAETERGYSLIQHQAQCPFRAFAINRLHAETGQWPDLDFDSRERGIVIHRALELFWTRIRSGRELQNLIDAQTLDQTLEPCITEALENFRGTLSQQNYFFKMEQERLRSLLRDWLMLESKRKDFSIVDTEKTLQTEINGLSLKMRVDRIDRIADKDTLLIDYKTGQPQTAKWYQDPIQEPQLPLYLLSQDADGIAFARIQKGRSQYRVMAQTDSLYEGMKLSPPNQEPLKGQPWLEIKKFWKTQIHNLSADFQKGFAKVSPHHPTNTCKHCDLETLCRKSEVLPNLVWSEREEDES